MISDEAEATAERERRAEIHLLMQEGEDLQPHVQDLLQDPERLQAAFDRGGFHVEVKELVKPLRGRGPPG
jgi:hypothetical protein